MADPVSAGRDPAGYRKNRARLIAGILDDADPGNLTELERAAIDEACDLLREVAADD